MRYFFLREVPFGQDGNYSHEAIVNRINADLANDLGNLAQRSLSMVFKNCDAAIPAPGAFSGEDEALLASADALLAQVRTHHEGQQLHKAIECIWQVVADANRYFAAQEPWALKKTDPDRMGTVLYVTAETVRQVAILAQPYMPGRRRGIAERPGRGRRCPQLCVPRRRKPPGRRRHHCQARGGVPTLCGRNLRAPRLGSHS